MACVASVLSQTDPNWEWFFVDDGSDDGSFELAIEKANGDDRCHFIKNTTGLKGANAARNLGIEKSSAPFVIFLDSDDVMLESCVHSRLTDFAKYPEIDYLVYPMGIFYDSIGDSDIINNIPTAQPDLYRFLNRDVVWQISGPIWKRSVLASLDGFSLELSSQQDIDLHIRALIAGFPYKYLHCTPDIYYRRNVASLPRQNSQSVAHIRQRVEMILRHLKLLKEAEKLDAEAKKLLARYLLDLAQMMRWHIVELGKEKAQNEALKIWLNAADWQLVTDENIESGMRYIKFKHQMLYNRFPALQKWMEGRLQNKLSELIFQPSSTYCNVTLKDYVG